MQMESNGSNESKMTEANGVKRMQTESNGSNESKMTEANGVKRRQSEPTKAKNAT
jgi:hypothetical protein